MSSIAEKALALVRGCEGCESWKLFDDALVPLKALYRAIEAHEADKQAFSDAVERLFDDCEEHIPITFKPELRRFIIKKPDPLEIAWNEVWEGDYGTPKGLDDLRAALVARGLGVARIGEVVEGQQP